MSKPTPVYILDAARTPIGSPLKSLQNFSAATLGARVIEGVLKRNNFPKEWVEEVILGNAVAAGTGQNLSRQSALAAGLPQSVAAFTVNQVCGGGLQSVILGAQEILCEDRDFVIAGGSESATQIPHLYFNLLDHFPRQGKKVNSLIHDGLFCQIVKRHMGQLADLLATEFKIGRSVQDRYSFQSHQKACRAWDDGKFAQEVIPLALGNERFFSKDERPRKNINLARLGDLSPAFKKGGTVSAGNSSMPSDGAAVVLLASEEFSKKKKLKPKARILAYAPFFVDPKYVFTAAVPAVENCLKKADLKISDVDLFEISEAFACQAIYTRRELKIPDEKMNIWGGDIALGHPLGAAGTRILVTLLSALEDRQKKRGLACVCLGGGGAIAIIVERF